jgi:hypothetical protein
VQIKLKLTIFASNTLEMNRIILFLVLNLFVFEKTGFAQIEYGKKGEIKPKKEKKEIKQKPDSSGLSIYGEYLFASSFRFLKPNGDFFGEELGERVNEKSIKTNNFTLGLEQQISKNFYLAFGLAFINYGEKYSETVSDSLFSYHNTYGFISIPVQMGYKKSISRFSFSISAGLQAQFLNSFINTQTYFKDGQELEITNKDDKHLNLTNLAFVNNLRLAYRLTNFVEYFVGTSYSLQLTSTYNKQQAYIHKGYLAGVKTGLVFNF